VSWLAALVGLAPIVGAYAAGLVLEKVHVKEFVGRASTSWRS
jgi:Kef-type K+ transport system membrane component KefB